MRDYFTSWFMGGGAVLIIVAIAGLLFLGILVLV